MVQRINPYQMKSYIAVPRSMLDECQQSTKLDHIRSRAWHEAYEKRIDYIICEVIEAVDVRPHIEIVPWEL